MTRGATLAVLVLTLIATAAPAKVITDLDDPGRVTRWGLLEAPRNKGTHPEMQGRRFRTADVTGDGYQELVQFNGRGVIAEHLGTNSFTALWQVNVPPDLAWTAETPPGPHSRYWNLGPAADINGDGQEEIFLTLCSADRSRWYLFVADPAAQEMILTVSLPLGPDRRVNGYWDGIWEAVGVLPPGQAGPGACVVLSTRVQYDAKPRGFSAVDLSTGEIVWRYAMGGNLIVGQVWLGDLEGDGAWEIVASCSAPDNLGGELVGGMSDDHSWLVVVGTDGKLRRCQRLERAVSGSMQAVADLDGDGVQEITIATINPPEGGKETLRIFSPDLELLARTATSGRATGLVTLPDRTGSNRIYLATDAGILARYRYHDGRIDPPDEAVTAGSILVFGAGDLLPDHGGELLLALDDMKRVMIVDTDLKPLLDTGRLTERANDAIMWTPDVRDPFLLLDEPGRNAWTIAQTTLNPRSVPWLQLAIAGAVVAVILALAIWRRYRHRAAPVPDTAARDVLSRLLADLEQSNHGAVAITRGLRQIQTPLSTLRGGFEVSARLRPHTRRTWEVFSETDLVTIREILARAESVGFETEAVRKARQALARVVDTLDGLMADDLPSADVDESFPRVKQDCETLEEGLQHLRRRLEAEFSCDLLEVLDRVRWAREFELERDEVTVQWPDTDGDWSVLIEPRDLRFILDNLVGNAIRAMADASRRDLTIGLSREGGAVVCRVADTGAGMTQDVRQRLFRTRFTTRDGGGLGLFRSYQLVNRWGGDIRVEKSTPGQGSTFLLQLVSAGPRLRLVEESGERTG